MHFNAEGLILDREDRNQNKTHYRYDNRGKLIEIVDPVGLITTFIDMIKKRADETII